MGSEKNVYGPLFYSGKGLFLLLCTDHSAHEGALEGETVYPLQEVVIVLLGKDCGGSQKGNLLAAHNCLECSTEGKLGLSVTHVSADETVHDRGALHVILYVPDTGKLVLRLLVFKLSFKTKLPVVVPGKGITLGVLPSCVKLNQVLCKAFGTLSGLCLLGFPAA